MKSLTKAEEAGDRPVLSPKVCLALGGGGGTPGRVTPAAERATNNVPRPFREAASARKSGPLLGGLPTSARLPRRGPLTSVANVRAVKGSEPSCSWRAPMTRLKTGRLCQQFLMTMALPAGACL